MADNAETAGDAQITFKVKSSGDKTHTITMPESATVLQIKTKLAGEDFENIEVDRQRLIYSGRVMKNDDTIATYKIKPNNTVHLVRSAASNPGQSASTSAPSATPQAIPSNMASGTANNPLAGLTGARYAGHVNLPGMDTFGPDGGMGPPMDEEGMSRMMSDPNVQQTMNEMLNNPDFVNMLIDSNPMLRNMPNARQLISSPIMRHMMTNPQMMRSAMRMSRNMQGGGGDSAAFPAPGATDTTSENTTTGSGNANQGQGDAAAQQNPFANPFMMPGMMGNNAGGEGPDMNQLIQSMQNIQSMYGGNGSNPFAPAAAGGQAGAATGGTGTQPSATPGQGQAEGQTGSQPSQNAPPANPFAALLGGGGNQTNPFGMNPEMMQQMMQMMGGGGGGSGGGTGAAAAPPDNRPPEERYADQLRQLNDMGFFNFEQNLAALRRSGGSVQGAVEALLSNTD